MVKAFREVPILLHGLLQGLLSCFKDFGRDSSAQLWGRGRKMSLRHLLGAVVVASCLHAGGALSGSSSMARPCALRAGEVMSGDRVVVADAKQWRRPGRNDKSAQLIKDSAVLSCLSL